MYNLLKQYNALLEVDSMSPAQRTISLRGVFNRDIQNNKKFSFREKKIYPIPKEGMDKLEMLFWHLTTKVVDYSTNHREYDKARSVRLHWIKYHIEEHKKDNMLIFSTKNGREKRTYIYDKTEQYVIVLEPKEAKRIDSEEKEHPYYYYYLLTAYKLEGKDKKRNKIEKPYERRLPSVL